MTEEEMKNFVILPSMIPTMLEIVGWPAEEIEELSKADLEWYAAAGNLAIREHFKTLSQESRSPNSK